MSDRLIEREVNGLSNSAFNIAQYSFYTDLGVQEGESDFWNFWFFERNTTKLMSADTFFF